MLYIDDVYRFVEQSKEFQFNHKGEIVSIEKPEVVLLNSAEELLDKMCKRLHCDFECIYSEHVSLDVVYKCNECGTIIFTGDDERYDINLACPVCANYNHSNYWTQEMIESDPDKKRYVEFLIKSTERQIEDNKIFVKRGNLYSWEVCHEKKIKIKNKIYTFKLECTDYPKSWLKGLHMKISTYTYDDNFSGYVYKHKIDIPLSITNIILRLKISKKKIIYKEK